MIALAHKETGGLFTLGHPAPVGKLAQPPTSLIEPDKIRLLDGSSGLMKPRLEGLTRLFEMRLDASHRAGRAQHLADEPVELASAVASDRRKSRQQCHKSCAPAASRFVFAEFGACGVAATSILTRHQLVLGALDELGHQLEDLMANRLSPGVFQRKLEPPERLQATAILTPGFFDGCGTNVRN
jgi:hypothetical protein